MLSMVRKLVKLAIVLLVANAIYQFVPPYMHYVQFKDAVRETAIFSKDVSDQALLESLIIFSGTEVSIVLVTSPERARLSTISLATPSGSIIIFLMAASAA